MLRLQKHQIRKKTQQQQETHQQRSDHLERQGRSTQSADENIIIWGTTNKLKSHLCLLTKIFNNLRQILTMDHILFVSFVTGCFIK